MKVNERYDNRINDVASTYNFPGLQTENILQRKTHNEYRPFPPGIKLQKRTETTYDDSTLNNACKYPYVKFRHFQQFHTKKKFILKVLIGPHNISLLISIPLCHMKESGKIKQILKMFNIQQEIIMLTTINNQSQQQRII